LSSALSNAILVGALGLLQAEHLTHLLGILPCELPASSVLALPVLKGSAQGLSGLFQGHRFWLHRLGWLDHDKE
jgi:hypothetical protein